MEQTPVRSGFERVARRADRTDPAWVFAVALDLRPNATHVFGHRRRILPLAGGVPDLGEELAVGEDAARRTREEGEQVELPSRQLRGPPVDAHLTRCRIDLEVAERQWTLGVGDRAPQHRARRVPRARGARRA